MNKILRKITEWYCTLSVRHPFIITLLMLALSIPAVLQVKKIKIETDLIRLLPGHSKAAVNTRELKNVVSDGGYFTFLIECKDKDRLLDITKKTAAELAKLDGVSSVDYTWPIDFIEKYQFSLISNDYLERILDKVIARKAELSPSGANLLEEKKEETWSDREDNEDLSVKLKQLAGMDKYHKSSDGTVMGMLVRTSKGITNLGSIRKLFRKLTDKAAELKKDKTIWAGVGGSHKNKIDEYSLITSDLSITGTVASILIVGLLLYSFRSVFPVIIVIYPLALGLLWGFAFVPVTVKSLNIITSFLLLILFGMGVDYSIHLVKRYRTELCNRDMKESLTETFLSTGSSVLISGLTTALSLIILAISDFKGFSEFGIITAIVIVTVLLAMFTVLPPAIVLATKIKLLKPKTSINGNAKVIGRKTTFVFTFIIIAGLITAINYLGFDYNFRNLQFDKSKIKGKKEIRERQNKVYSGSMSPGAIYIAKDIKALDELTRIINENKKNLGDKTKIGRIRSIRDYSPDSETYEERTELLTEIREEVINSDGKAAKWTNKIKDDTEKQWIDRIVNWEPGNPAPTMNDIPDVIKKPLLTKDNTGKYILAIHPGVDRKDGRNAMAFTKELYDLKMPEGIEGPVGETAVFAEILWIVTSETTLLTLLTFLGVFILVWLNLGSAMDTLWVLSPLFTGLALTFGIMAIFNIQFNFFNVVVLPALLGMGVDDGVHYFRHWKECGKDTDRTQKELLGPLTITTVTTMLGYSGMIFANHPGIQSIGTVACIGLMVIWFTSVILMPGMLKYFYPVISRRS